MPPLAETKLTLEKVIIPLLVLAVCLTRWPEQQVKKAVSALGDFQ
jgi:hypothetical protein